MTQFLRIATESAPDPSEVGVPDGVAAVIEGTMARDPQARPSLIVLGESLRQLQDRYGFAVDAMPVESDGGPSSEAAPAGRRGRSSTTSAVLHTLHHTLYDLPLELTSFIGRDAELAELEQLMATSRLVTVTGVGGVGKTRLALRAGTELRAAPEEGRTFPDGVLLIDFSELRDESAVFGAVAASFGLRDGADVSLAELLVDHLITRKLLLILDNCEQVIDAVAGFSAMVLEACRDVRILATSREAMDIAGERVLSLLPLGDDAVKLFVERAVAVAPRFRLVDNNKAAVAEICSRLDGLPLAIELAAAKLRVMSPPQILKRLDNRYDLLAGGNRRAPQRQQALALSIGWSYDLCSQPERKLWRWLSIFAGDFDLEAAEDICVDEFPVNSIDLLASLVDKSILIRIELDDTVRFRFLAPLRDYGRQKLQDENEYLSLRNRHLDWCQRLTRDVQAMWFSSRQAECNKRLDRELPNLREAIDFALTDAPQTAARMVCDTYGYCSTHCLIGESRSWLGQALSAMSFDAASERTTALCYASIAASEQRDFQVAIAYAQQARALAEQLSDPAVNALVDIAGGYALLKDDPAQGCELLQVGIDRCSNLTIRADAMVDLAWAHAACRDADAAFGCHQDLLELTSAHGELSYHSFALWGVGIERWRSGDREYAVDALKRGLRLAYELRDVQLGASCLEVLGFIAAEADDWIPATVMMTAANTISPTVGNWTSSYPNLPTTHEECAERIQTAVDAQAYSAAQHKGGSLTFRDAVTYALDHAVA